MKRFQYFHNENVSSVYEIIYSSGIKVQQVVGFNFADGRGNWNASRDFALANLLLLLLWFATTAANFLKSLKLQMRH